MAVTMKVTTRTGRASRRGRGDRARAGHGRLLPIAVAVAALVAGCTGAPASDDTPTGPPTGTQGAAPGVASESTPAPAATSTTAAPTAGPGEETPAAADAQMAVAMCGWLVAAHTELGNVADEAVEGISAAEPVERMESVMAGYATAIEVAEGFPDDLEDRDFPDVPERDRLVDEVAAGAVEAADELDDEREAFAGRGSEIADEDVFGAVGQFFNGFEKAMSSLEPSLAGDARPELQAAFLEEESCQFVIQPFPVDD